MDRSASDPTEIRFLIAAVNWPGLARSTVPLLVPAARYFQGPGPFGACALLAPCSLLLLQDCPNPRRARLWLAALRVNFLGF